MLVLTRKKGEKIVIGENITITVVEIRGDKVRLGIEAPKDVGVHREEIWVKIQAGELPPSGEPQTDDSKQVTDDIQLEPPTEQPAKRRKKGGSKKKKT